jgi:hypothetical protein
MPRETFPPLYLGFEVPGHLRRLLGVQCCCSGCPSLALVEPGDASEWCPRAQLCEWERGRVEAMRERLRGGG